MNFVPTDTVCTPFSANPTTPYGAAPAPLVMDPAVPRLDQHAVHLADHLLGLVHERDAVLLHLLREPGDPLRRQDRLAGAADHDPRPLDELLLVGADLVEPARELD